MSAPGDLLALLGRLDDDVPCDVCGDQMEPVDDEERAVIEEAIHTGTLRRIDRLCRECMPTVQPGFHPAAYE